MRDNTSPELTRDGASEGALQAENPFKSPVSSGLLGEADVPPRKRIVHLIGVALSLGIFALSLFVLARMLATVGFAELRAAVAATSAEQITGAALLAALSYLALTGYDALALKQLGLKVRYKTTALASFTSYAVSFTLGFPLITGGTVRYWIYSQVGLSAAKVASLTLIAGVTFWLGMALVIGAGLTFRAEAIADINQLKIGINMLIGIGILVGIVAYLIWVSLKRRHVRIKGFKLELPGFRLTSGQILLGLVDLCAAAGVLFLLLPGGHGMDFFTFAASYVFACIIGIASHAPGGIGVFEATMVQVVPAPEAKLLASLLLFRVIYYLVPFVLAMAMLGAHEAFRRWNSLREAMIRSAEQRDNLSDN